LNAALGPQPVKATANAQFGLRADIALKNFAVIADMADDAHHPILREAKLLAEGAVEAEKPADFRLFGF